MYTWVCPTRFVYTFVRSARSNCTLPLCHNTRVVHCNMANLCLKPSNKQSLHMGSANIVLVHKTRLLLNSKITSLVPLIISHVDCARPTSHSSSIHTCDTSVVHFRLRTTREVYTLIGSGCGRMVRATSGVHQVFGNRINRCPVAFTALGVSFHLPVHELGFYVASAAAAISEFSVPGLYMFAFTEHSRCTL